jgi:anti-anti-sigma factor
VATLTVEDRGSSRWILLAGELDREGCSAVAAEFDAALSGEASPVVIDMGAVSFIASYGLRLILGAHNTLRKQERALQLARVRGGVLDAFVATGLLEAIPLIES